MRALRLLSFLLFACTVAGIVLISALSQQKNMAVPTTAKAVNLTNFSAGFSLAN